MNTNLFPPGPFTAEGHTIRDRNGRVIATTFTDEITPAEMESTARMLAAAPALRDALHGFLYGVPDDEMDGRYRGFVFDARVALRSVETGQMAPNEEVEALRPVYVELDGAKKAIIAARKRDEAALDAAILRGAKRIAAWVTSIHVDSFGDVWLFDHEEHTTINDMHLTILVQMLIDDGVLSFQFLPAA